MTIADEIRVASGQDTLHPLVRDNWASARGICNCSKHVDSGLVFCQLDYGHVGLHVNGPNQWEAAWPPPELYHG